VSEENHQSESDREFFKMEVQLAKLELPTPFGRRLLSTGKDTLDGSGG